jgi:enoyl-CoA hydratase/carnithine racemase
VPAGASVVLDVADGVATVTLNRPERLNAWTGRMETEYRSAMASAEADERVRVIVVTGAGRGFCAGADAAALEKLDDAGQGYDSGVREPVEIGFAWQLRMTKPVIAVVNGPAAGVGLVLALFCDLRFAVPGAKLTTSFARLGLPAEHGSSWLLPRLVGRSRAADLLFTSRVVLAEEALGMGLVDRVCSVDDALGEIRSMARHSAPASLRAIKQQLWDDQSRPLDESIADAYVRLHDMFGGDDLREGVRAIREKRLPEF